MAEPRPPRPGSTNDDAGFPPLREVDDEVRPDADEADDFDGDFHEEGGGD